MGIHVTKEQDPDLYRDIAEEAQRLLTISDEIRVSVKKVDKKAEDKKTQEIKNPAPKKDYSKSKLLTTKELAQNTGISSRKINSWLVDNKLMYKKEDDWISTKKGNEAGAVSKEGQYGKFVVWPEEIALEIED